jgi:hypothetical protein
MSGREESAVDENRKAYRKPRLARLGLLRRLTRFSF